LAGHDLAALLVHCICNYRQGQDPPFGKPGKCRNSDGPGAPLPHRRIPKVAVQQADLTGVDCLVLRRGVTVVPTWVIGQRRLSSLPSLDQRADQGGAWRRTACSRGGRRGRGRSPASRSPRSPPGPLTARQVGSTTARKKALDPVVWYGVYHSLEGWR